MPRLVVGPSRPEIVRLRRRDAYPPVGDALDAIAKGLAAYRDGKPLPPETLAWLDACAEVKRRHPKP